MSVLGELYPIENNNLSVIQSKMRKEHICIPNQS